MPPKRCAMAKRPAPVPPLRTSPRLMNKVARRDRSEDAQRAARTAGMREYASHVQTMFRSVAPQLAASVSRARYDELRVSMSTSLCVEEGGPTVHRSCHICMGSRHTSTACICAGWCKPADIRGSKSSDRPRHDVRCTHVMLRSHGHAGPCGLRRHPQAQLWAWQAPAKCEHTHTHIHRRAVCIMRQPGQDRLHPWTVSNLMRCSVVEGKACRACTKCLPCASARRRPAISGWVPAR